MLSGVSGTKARNGQVRFQAWCPLASVSGPALKRSLRRGKIPASAVSRRSFQYQTVDCWFPQPRELKFATNLKHSGTGRLAGGGGSFSLSASCAAKYIWANTHTGLVAMVCLCLCIPHHFNPCCAITRHGIVWEFWENWWLIIFFQYFSSLKLQ